MALSFNEILRQRQQQAQAIPDALNPNAPQKQPSALDALLTPQMPQVTPDALLPQDAYDQKHNNDFVNKLMQGIKPNSPMAITDLPVPPVEDPEMDKDLSAEDPEYKPTEEDLATAEEPKKSSAPKKVRDEIDNIEDTDNSVKDYKAAHDTYGINTLDQKQQQSRELASRFLKRASMMEMTGNVTGIKPNTSVLRAQADNELGKAQDYQRLLNEQKSEMQQDIQSDAAGISHTKALDDLSSEKAMHDPDSDISVSARAALAGIAAQTGMSIPIDDKMPYTALIKVAPWVEKYMQNHEMMEARKEMAAQRTATMQLMKDQQMEKFYDQQGPQFAKAINASMASSRSQLGTHARNINMADRMINQFGDKKPDDLNKQQIATLTSDYVGMMVGGIPTAAAINKMFPESAAGSVQDVTQWITGDPTGRRQGKFVTMMLDGVKHLRDVSQQRIKESIDTSAKGFAGYVRARPQDAQDAIDAAVKQLAPMETPGQQGNVTIRRKSDGITKTLKASDAQKYLQDPNFEQVK